MPFREPGLALRDIADAILRIEEFVEGMDFEAFRQDARTVAAVERKLLVIAEAAVRLGEQGPALCPGIPWRNIRGTGNWLRHQYDRVDLETVWGTLLRNLPELKVAVISALAERLPRDRTAYLALSRFANKRYAPGTPAGSSRNHTYDEKIYTPFP